MIEIKDIEQRYCKRIPKKFKVNLEKYIYDARVQAWLKSAMEYELTDAEVSYIYKIGNQKAKEYPGLYYIATIFIHPLTIAQAICEKAERLGVIL